MNLLAGQSDPLDFVLMALRSGYFFPGKLIINHKTLKSYQLVVRKRNNAFLKICSLSTPVYSEDTRSVKQPHDDYVNNVINFAYLIMKNSSFARFARAFLIFGHLRDVLVLFMT